MMLASFLIGAVCVILIIVGGVFVFGGMLGNDIRVCIGGGLMIAAGIILPISVFL